MITCKTCSETKEDFEFGSTVDKKSGREYFQKVCRVCRHAKYRERQSDSQLESRYGITRAQWELILKSQDGKCKICGKEFGGKIRTQVDHDHKTQVVRGVICSTCNKALEYFDDPVLFEKAVDYVKHSNALKELLSKLS